MIITKTTLYALAAICFVIAALPHRMVIRFEWLGAAFFTAAQL